MTATEKTFRKVISWNLHVIVRPRRAIESIRVNSKAATGFFHLAIVNSGPLLFLRRNTMFWPNLENLAASAVDCM